MGQWITKMNPFGIGMGTPGMMVQNVIFLDKVSEHLEEFA